MEQRSVANSLPPLTPFDSATMIQSLGEQGRGVRVVFYRPQSATDRWGHMVATVEQKADGEQVTPQLISSEGTSSDGWPLSPPLQSLAIEERPEGSVALLVGMSGQNHWSASFEVVPSKGRILVDVACKLATGTKEWSLGSRYLARPGWQALELEMSREIVITSAPDGIRLEVKPTKQQPVRWKYTLELADLRTNP